MPQFWKLVPLIVIIFAACCNPACGQEENAEEPPAIVDETLLTLQNQLKTPRKTVQTFLDAMQSKEFETAYLCFDLSELDIETASAKQRTYAVKLNLAFAEYFGLADLSALSTNPNEPKQPYPVCHETAMSGVVLVKDSNKLWRFSRSTVKLLDSDELDFLFEDADAEEHAAWSVPLWLQQRFPKSWWGTTFLLKDYEWVCLLGLLAGGYLVSLLCRFILDYLTQIWFRLTGTDVDDQPRRRLWTPMVWLLQIWIWYYGMKWIDLPAGVLGIVLPVLKFFTIVAAVWCGFRLINLLQNYLAKKAKLTASRYDDSLIPLVCSGLKLLAMVVGVIAFVDVFDKDWKALLGGFGVVGIAVAIAAKDLLGNIFGSITVLADRPFEIGDWVVIDEKVEGTVEQVGIRSSRVRTFHNSEIIVPNSLLTNAIVDNMGRRKFRRFKTHLQIKYNTPVDRIESMCAGIRQLVQNNPYARKESAHVYLNQFSECSIDILVYVFFDCSDWSVELRERHCLLMDILRLAEKIGVEFAFPTRTLEIDGPEQPNFLTPKIRQANDPSTGANQAGGDTDT